MAQELRHETLSNTVADGVTDADAAAEFRNDSSGIIHIRGITCSHRFQLAQNGERASPEVSKSPTMAFTSNNNVFFTWPQTLAMGTGSATDDVVGVNDGRKWGKGQLTLEPNESLFVNVNKTSGGALVFNYVVEYEFG